MARTNIAVDELVADALSDEARRQNKTLYAFANESLNAVLKLCRDGGRLDEIHRSWRFTRILKDIDSVPIPGDLLEKMIKRLHAFDREWLLGAWFDQGFRLGGYLQMSSPRMEDLSKELGELRDLLPVKRAELERIDGEKEQFIVRVVGAGLSAESTGCAEQFINGIISSFSFHVVSTRTSEGIIEIKIVNESKS